MAVVREFVASPRRLRISTETIRWSTYHWIRVSRRQPLREHSHQPSKIQDLIYPDRRQCYPMLARRQMYWYRRSSRANLGQYHLALRGKILTVEEGMRELVWQLLMEMRCSSWCQEHWTGNGEGKRAWNQRRNAQRKAKKSAALTDDVALCTSPLLYLSFKEYKPIALLQQNPWDVFDRYCWACDHSLSSAIGLLFEITNFKYCIFHTAQFFSASLCAVMVPNRRWDRARSGGNEKYSLYAAVYNYTYMFYRRLIITNEMIQTMQNLTTSHPRRRIVH